jgi:uncharacterized protein DUF6958
MAGAANTVAPAHWSPYLPENIMAQQPPVSPVVNILIDREKYDLVRQAILDTLPAAEDGITWVELTEKIGPLLPERLFRHMGTVRWYARAVQLDLEAQGDIMRIPDSKPLRLRRVA